jgi:hypothetical protein
MVETIMTLCLIVGIAAAAGITLTLLAIALDIIEA